MYTCMNLNDFAVVFGQEFYGSAVRVVDCLHINTIEMEFIYVEHINQMHRYNIDVYVIIYTLLWFFANQF